MDTTSTPAIAIAPRLAVSRRALRIATAATPDATFSQRGALRADRAEDRGGQGQQHEVGEIADVPEGQLLEEVGAEERDLRRQQVGRGERDAKADDVGGDTDHGRNRSADRHGLDQQPAVARATHGRGDGEGERDRDDVGVERRFESGARMVGEQRRERRSDDERACCQCVRERRADVRCRGATATIAATRSVEGASSRGTG